MLETLIAAVTVTIALSWFANESYASRQLPGGHTSSTRGHLALSSETSVLRSHPPRAQPTIAPKGAIVTSTARSPLESFACRMTLSGHSRFMDSVNKAATHLADVLLRVKSLPRLARFALVLLPDHTTLRAVHRTDLTQCSLEAVLDLATRLTPRKERSKARGLSRALLLAASHKPATAQRILTNLDACLPRNADHSGAAQRALTSVVVSTPFQDLAPLAFLDARALRITLTTGKHISSAINNTYPQHKTRHMHRLLCALADQETSSLSSIRERIESHPGFSSPVFPKAVLTIARQQGVSASEVLDVLAVKPHSCEMVLAFIVAGTPGTLQELQDAAGVILQHPELPSATA